MSELFDWKITKCRGRDATEIFSIGPISPNHSHWDGWHLDVDEETARRVVASVKALGHLSVEEIERLTPLKRVSPQDETWGPGSYVVNDCQQKIFVEAGLFYYSGFGMGHYYAKDGRILWLTSTAAGEMARDEGVPFIFKDALEGSL